MEFSHPLPEFHDLETEVLYRLPFEVVRDCGHAETGRTQCDSLFPEARIFQVACSNAQRIRGLLGIGGMLGRYKIDEFCLLGRRFGGDGFGEVLAGAFETNIALVQNTGVVTIRPYDKDCASVPYQE